MKPTNTCKLNPHAQQPMQPIILQNIRPSCRGFFVVLASRRRYVASVETHIPLRGRRDVNHFWEMRARGEWGHTVAG
jgi:hypothetical protein